MPATVDVIVPAFDVEGYVVEAVTSALNQTYPSEAISVIVVDDGSTDGTVEAVLGLCRSNENVTLLRSDRSGSPAVPRNMGIEHGTADYIFFLDADDWLDTRALEGLIDAAETHQADVVLGKLDGVNDRSVPRSMFHETTMDADLVNPNLFYSLGPTKLFRRSLIEANGLRFPTDIRVGQDQPFVAEAMLLARRICVLADRVYYYVRRDDERLHLSQTSQSPAQIIHRTRRVADIIARHTEPDERRALLLRRPFGLDLPKALGDSLAALERPEQESAIAQASELLELYGDPRTFAPMDVRKRVLLELARQKDTQALLDLHRHRNESDRRDLVAKGERWVLDVPRSVAAVIEEDTLHVPEPPTVCLLTEIQADDEVMLIAGWAGALRAALPPTAVHVQLRRRDSSRALRVRVSIGDAVEGIRSHGREFTATVALSDLERGMWDVVVSTSTGSAGSGWVRLGETRDRAVPAREHETAAALVQVVADQGVSVDVGYTEAAFPVHLQLVGTTHDADGLAEVIVRTDADPATLEVFGTVSPTGSRGAPLLLPSRVLGHGLLAARLPEAGSEPSRIALDAVRSSRARRLRPDPSLALEGDEHDLRLEVTDGHFVIPPRSRPAPYARRRDSFVWWRLWRRAGGLARRMRAKVRS